MIRPTLLLSFSLLALLLTGCGKGNIALDNSGKESVSFTIDKVEYSVAAGSTEFISLDPGKHTFTVNKGTLKDVPFEVKESGLLHDGTSKYVTWKILYGLEKFRKSELKEDTLEVDSLLFFGDFTLYPDSQFYIEGKWDYGVNEPLPESKDLYVNSDFLIKTKLFRKEDFIATYKKLSGVE
jgi:hypothetical protein